MTAYHDQPIVAESVIYLALTEFVEIMTISTSLATTYSLQSTAERTVQSFSED